MNIRHFLSLLDLSTEEITHILHRAIELKKQRQLGEVYEPFKNQVMAMIFEKSSTRTRVSFEAGMAQLGGHAMFLSPKDTQLGRGEPLSDSARVISSMVDIIMIRTFDHDNLVNFAAHSQVPVINALSDDFHPCQLLADMQTFLEVKGSIQGKKVAWIGDGNNMCHSYINAARQLDFELSIAYPPGFEPKESLVNANKDRLILTHSPQEAVKEADLVVTDVWASMGQEDEQLDRAQQFSGFQVNSQLMSFAKTDALFTHCLPAHRGEEVTHEVLEAPNSIAFQAAENRLHAQKALIEFLLLQ